jgi:hypothetical protein
MRYGARLAWFGIGLVLALVLVAGVLAAAMLGYVGGSTTVHPNSNFSVAKARQFRDFPVFYAGEEVNGQELTATNYEPLGPMRKSQWSVGFSYGTCDIGPGFDPGGCSLPVSISNEPACSRNLAMYGGALSPKPHMTRVRGTTAAFFEGGSRLEIQTGTTTVVIFAWSKREAVSVAENLRGLNVPTSPSDRLPPPAPGAVEGTLLCGTR